ncbi:MAG: HPr family phosphocarrier protein [Lachnospiraceae bacterium]|nr:HPr family phosphocarrier protein [Lachnospiraceae bacterium]MBQ9135823.1 HPr family phosphocarrier protein [Lachnospiraceae bacterium]
MKEFRYTITDPEGIHARPAGELIKAVKDFASKITITKDGKVADAKSIFSVMGLAVKQGQEIVIAAEGDDEEEAITAIEQFLKEKM